MRTPMDVDVEGGLHYSTSPPFDEAASASERSAYQVQVQGWSNRRHPIVDTTDVAAASAAAAAVVEDDEEDEDHPFDCPPVYTEEEAAEAAAKARRYSPWNDNRGTTRRRVASVVVASAASSPPDRLFASTSSPPRRATSRPTRHSPLHHHRNSSTSAEDASPSRRPSSASSASSSPSSNSATSHSSTSKSRPWRVDVLLKKGKGVRRSTNSWKQQMKERKQVFALSGVTVPEGTGDDDLFGDLTEDDEGGGKGEEEDAISKGGIDDSSEKAVIGTPQHDKSFQELAAAAAAAAHQHKPQPRIPGMIDLTDLHVIMNDLHQSEVNMSPCSPPRLLDLQNEQNETGPMRIRSRLDDVVVSGADAWSEGIEREEEGEDYDHEDAPRDEIDQTQKKSVIADLQSTLQQFPLDEHAFETTGKLLLSPEQDEKKEEAQDHQSPTTALIANLRTTQKQLDDHCETSFERGRPVHNDDDDNDDDVRSVRSIASAVFPSSPIRKEQTRIEANRQLLIQSLQATFPADFDPNERYTLTSTGRAGLDPPKRIKNEYFIVHQRFQRSRLVNELYSALALLPTRHFQVVEAMRDANQNHHPCCDSMQVPTTPSQGSGSLETLLSFEGGGMGIQSSGSADTMATHTTTATTTTNGSVQKEEEEEKAMVVQDTSNHKRATVECDGKDATGETHVKKEEEAKKAMVVKEASNHERLPAESDDKDATGEIMPMNSVKEEEKAVVVVAEDASNHDRQPEKSDEKAMVVKEASNHERLPAESDDKDATGAIMPLNSVKEEEKAVVVVVEDASNHDRQPEKSDEKAMVVKEASNHETAPEKLDDTDTTASYSPATTTNIGENIAMDEPMSSCSQSPTQPAAQSAQPQTTVASTTNVPPAPMEDLSSPQISEQGDAENEAQGKSPGKKSKASKWKDRLAKRKSVTKRKVDISNASSESPESPSSPLGSQKSPSDTKRPSGSLVDTPTAPGKPPKEPTSVEPMAPKLPNESDGSLEGDSLSNVLAATGTTPKGRRKSMKWKERLASKRSSKLEGDSPGSDKEMASPAIPEENDVPSLSVEEEKAPNTDDAEPKSTAVAPVETAEEPPAAPKSVATAQEAEKPPKPAQSEEVKTLAIELTESSAPTPSLHKDLRNSFMAFDSLLKQRQGSDSNAEGDVKDDYSEYTIEESVLHLGNDRKSIFQRGTGRAKSPDNESHFEEITVEQSFMEFTVEETIGESADESDQPTAEPNVNMTPIHQATSNLMSSRMFTTPQIAKEPTITVNQVDDDDMTQLTFDQSYVEPRKKTTQPPPSVIKGAVVPMSDSLSKVDTKETQASTSGSMQGSRKRSSMNSSFRSGQRSQGSKGGGSAASDRNTKRVADILRKDIWSRDPKVVQEGLESIAVEACRGSRYRGKITQCGGVMGIVRAMESHREAEAVQASGCTALARMAWDPETQVIIGEMGGIAATLDAMKIFKASERVHEAGCEALANITRHRGTTDEAEGAVPILCASMTRHSKNMVVQAKAFGAIANLCMDDELRLKELSDAGGMLAMTMALQQPWPNKTEKHEAISNLSILLRCLAEHEEGGDHEEVYDEYSEQGEDEGDDVSAVSGLEEAPSEDGPEDQPTDHPPLEDKGSREEETIAEIISQVHAESPPKSTKDDKKVQALEQGSNSTQPTESTSRDGKDENCIVS